MPKLREYITLFLALVMLLQGVSLGIMFSQFKAQADVLESKFCENKARTDFECGGQCYFMKKMKAASSPMDAENSQIEILVNFQPVFFQDVSDFSFEKLDFKKVWDDKPLIPMAYINDLFIPPRKA